MIPNKWFWMVPREMARPFLEKAGNPPKLALAIHWNRKLSFRTHGKAAIALPPSQRNSGSYGKSACEAFL
jgi:hypothetical protein